MTITRHTLAAETTAGGYYRRDPAPLFGARTDVVGHPSWAPPTSGVTLSAVLDPDIGRTVVRSVAGPSAPVRASMMRDVPVLAPGFYRVAARVRAATTVPVRADVTLTANGATVARVTGSTGTLVVGSYVELWEIVQVTGTATAMFGHVSHQRETTPAGATTQLLVDGWSITRVTYADVVDLRPTDAQVTVDESWTPYARATLTCPVPQDDVLSRLDPRTATRVRLTQRRAVGASRTAAELPALLPGPTAAAWTARHAGPPVWTVARLSALTGAPYDTPPRLDLDATRTLDLMLRTRTVDHVAGTMTLELTSDEAALLDFARYDTDFTERLRPPTTTSLAALVRWALGLLGWQLDAGAVDATIDPTAVVWNLGESLWDFLDAHVRASNRRLWCDEQRRWRLSVPHTGTTGTPVVVERPTSAVDVLSRGQGYADTVVVIYEWTDETGEAQRVHGVSDWSTGQPVTLVQRWATPSTLAQATQAAAGLRRRAASRGRQVDVEAVADPGVTPGRPLVVTGTTTPLTDAMVSAVTWSYPDDVMTIRTRDATT